MRSWTQYNLPSVSFSAQAPPWKAQKPWLYYKLCLTPAVNEMILPIIPHAQTGFPELCVHKNLHHFGVVFTTLHKYLCQFIKWFSIQLMQLHKIRWYFAEKYWSLCIQFNWLKCFSTLLFHALLPVYYMNPTLFVLTHFKTSLEVPSVILQMFLCWDTEERDNGKEISFAKGIQLKCHLQKWWWSSKIDGLIHFRILFIDHEWTGPCLVNKK